MHSHFPEGAYKGLRSTTSLCYIQVDVICAKQGIEYFDSCFNHNTKTLNMFQTVCRLAGRNLDFSPN